MPYLEAPPPRRRRVSRAGHRAVAAALAAGALLAAVPGCQSAPSRPSPSSGAATTPPAGTFVTGAKATDDPCARVISAMGYLDALLVPEGEERRQRFEDAVRGRFGYLAGTIAEYGRRLPPAARPAADEIGGVSREMANARTERARRPGLLRDYRRAAHELTAACRASSPPPTG